MGYLTGESNIKVGSYFMNSGKRCFRFCDEDVGLNVFVTNKETDELMVELNQLESLELWNHLNNYFGDK
jgi:hypothetical protein